QQLAFQAVIRKKMSFFQRNPLGGVISRVTNDTEAMGNMILLIIGFLGDFMMVGILLIVLLSIEWKLTLVIVFMIPVFAGAALLFKKVGRGVSARLFQTMAEVNSSYKETIG